MKYIYSVFLAVLLNLLAVFPVQAKVITQEKGLVTIPAGEVINDDLFIAAESVDISGTVNGDIYVGAGTVNFSGQVSGDLVIGAGTVSLDQAIIGDSLIIGAGTVNIDEKSKINGSLIVGSGTLDNQASVGRNVMVGAGMVKLNAPVGGEAHLWGSSLVLGSKTIIAGDLTYGVENELNLAETAIVKGRVMEYQAPAARRFNDPKTQAQMIRVWRSAKLTLHFVSFFGALLTGLVILWLFKTPVVAVAEKISSRFLPSLGWGLVMLFVVPPTLFLLGLTIIGLPLAGLAGLLFLIDLCLAKIFASLALGKAMQRYFNWQKLSVTTTFSVGLIAYYLLRLIPGVGFFVHLVALLAGLGGCWLSYRVYHGSNVFSKRPGHIVS